MTDQSLSYNLRTLRKLLLESFNSDELRALVLYDDRLGSLTREFARADAITVMVDKTIAWCDRRDLLRYLLQLVKQERPEKYKLFEPELLITGTELPREEEPPEPIPDILTITSPIYLDLVRVPAGEFPMGSVVARDKHARDNEFPPHRVYVPEFHIGQYPVTNLQYAAFLEAGHSEAPLWLWFNDGKAPPGKENHPVVEIWWKHALAFCAWLSEETGRPFRLPTEAQWEKAARGTDGRIYPWGDQPPDEKLCNFGRKVGDTTPIGRYSPQGDSPYGCADMAGNVWDRCQSLDRPYPYRAGDGREDARADGPRVVRGGSAIDSQRYVRSAIRLDDTLGSWYKYLGFRVVVASDPSGL